jgi:hypothetical protein
MWFTVGIRRPSCRMTPAFAYLQYTISCKSVMNLCSKSGNTWNKLSTSTRSSMITSTGSCNSRREKGSGFASYMGQWLLSTSRAGANSSQNSMARSRYSSVWAMWHTSSSYRPAPSFMTCSMSGCSSRSMESHRRRRERYLQFAMAAPTWSRW